MIKIKSKCRLYLTFDIDLFEGSISDGLEMSHRQRGCQEFQFSFRRLLDKLGTSIVHDELHRLLDVIAELVGEELYGNVVFVSIRKIGLAEV
jgi:hypothetical protein